MPISVSVVGRICRDAEVNAGGANGQFVKFAIVTQRPYKNAAGERDADFWDVSCFVRNDDKSGQIDRMVPQLTKGTFVGVVGSQMEQDRWEDQDGNKRSKVVIKLFNLWSVSTPPPPRDSREKITGDDEDVPF